MNTWSLFGEQLPYSGCGNPYALNNGIGPAEHCDKDCSTDSGPCTDGTCGVKLEEKQADGKYITDIMGGGANIAHRTYLDSIDAAGIESELDRKVIPPKLENSIKAAGFLLPKNPDVYKPEEDCWNIGDNDNDDRRDFYTIEKKGEKLNIFRDNKNSCPSGHDMAAHPLRYDKGSYDFMKQALIRGGYCG